MAVLKEEVNRSPNARIGTGASFVSYEKNWGNVSNTPYRTYKSMTNEGGIITPLIVHWPNGIDASGRLIREVVHINDIMPTCLDIARPLIPISIREGKFCPLMVKVLHLF